MVIDSDALMAIVRLAVALRCVGLVESVTVICTVLDPTALGVPVMAPAALIESPAGRPVALKLYPGVPPVALTEAV